MYKKDLTESCMKFRQSGLQCGYALDIVAKFVDLHKMLVNFMRFMYTTIAADEHSSGTADGKDNGCLIFLPITNNISTG